MPAFSSGPTSPAEGAPAAGDPAAGDPAAAPSPLLERFADALRDPHDGTPLAGVDRARGVIRFQGGGSYPLAGDAPVLIDERHSLFRVRDVVARRPVIQDRAYRDPARLKNFVRRKVLPSLSHDFHLEACYRALAAAVGGAPVLVLGAGDRVEGYRALFHPSPVVASDVHLQFGADLALDAHRIPFRDGLFGLVLAAQVLEHTARPWRVADEIQRVTADGGLIQIEVPFAFPYHSQPYDFFRFTPSSLRLLFARSALSTLRVAEGAAGAAATFQGQLLIDKFNHRQLRRLALLLGRLAFGWMKYLDFLPTFDPARRVTSPKGFAATYRKDGRQRSDREMIDEVRQRFCAATAGAAASAEGTGDPG